MAADKTANGSRKAESKPKMVTLELSAEFPIEDEYLSEVLETIRNTVEELRGIGSVSKAKIVVPQHEMDMS